MPSKFNPSDIILSAMSVNANDFIQWYVDGDDQDYLEHKLKDKAKKAWNKLEDFGEDVYDKTHKWKNKTDPDIVRGKGQKVIGNVRDWQNCTIEIVDSKGKKVGGTVNMANLIIQYAKDLEKQSDVHSVRISPDDPSTNRDARYTQKVTYVVSKVFPGFGLRETLEEITFQELYNRYGRM